MNEQNNNGTNPMNEQNNMNSMNNQQPITQNPMNNGVIRSMNIKNEYESLDDEYTKVKVEEEQKRIQNAITFDMNRMENMTVENSDAFDRKENFFSKVKNKVMDLVNKVRGNSQSSLSSMELKKMDRLNGVDSTSSDSKQIVQPTNLTLQDSSIMNQQNSNSVPKNMQVQNSQNVMNNQPPQKQGFMQNFQKNMNEAFKNNTPEQKGVFAGLPNNNPKDNKGFLNNLFHKDKKNNPGNGQDVTEPWMLNQPLSAKSLGVSQNEVKKDVVVYDDTGKYFNPTADISRVGEDNSLHTENFAKPLFEKKINPNRDDISKKNGSLVKNYLSTDYDTISMGIFSFSGLLFGGIYLISYKLFVIGLLLVALQMYMLLYLPLKTGLIAYAIFSLIMAFVSNPLILFFVNLKIKFYRLTHKKMVEVQLSQYVSNKKSRSVFLAFIVFLVAIGGSAYLYFDKHMKFEGLLGQGYHFINEKYNEYTAAEVVKIEYAEKSGIEDVFAFTIPEGFVKENDKDLYVNTINNLETNNTCHIKMDKVTNMKDANSLMMTLRKTKNVKGTIDVESLNDVIFTTFGYSNDSGKYSYLAVKVSDNLYLLEFYGGSNTPKNVCDNYFDEFKDSLKKIDAAVPPKE